MDLDVIVVNDFSAVNGGAAQVAVQSAVALAQRGARITFFSAVGPISDELSQVKNIEVICLGQEEILHDPNRFRAVSQGIWNTKASHEFQRVLATRSSNNIVIHVHGISKAITSSIIRVTTKMHCALVFTLHDYFVGCPNGLFYNYPQKQICHLRGRSLNCLISNCDSRSYSHKLWRYGRALIENHFGGLPSKLKHFVAISDFSAQILASYLPKGSTVHRIDNPINVHKDEPVKVSANTPLVCVGRLSYEKGQNLLAMASRDLDWPIVLVGDGFLKQELLNINPNIKITGWLSRDDVIREIKQARALVFPSPVYETLGMVVLEAAACGVPCVVSNTSAARDLVKDGETGLWFDGGSIVDLQRKLNLLADNQYAERMGLTAYNNFWAKPRGIDQHANSLLELYGSILREN